jgi:hypothetical protein
MKQLADGSWLIHAELDGPCEPVEVKSVQTKPTLMEHHLEHGRPTTQREADRQETIKRLIKEMQTRKPSMTFVQCWNLLQQKRPELFTF